MNNKLYIIMLIFFACVLNVYAIPPLNDSTAMYFNLDTGQEQQNNSVLTGSNGTVINNVYNIPSNSGLGNAMNWTTYNKSNYISIPTYTDILSVFTQPTYAISFWLKPSTSTPANNGMIFQKRNPAENQEFSVYQMMNGSLRFEPNEATTLMFADDLTNISSYVDDTFHFYVINYDTNNHSATLYIDNVLISEVGYSANTVVSADGDLWIGRGAYASSDSGFLGGIDEVALYYRALTLSEINRSYNNGSGLTFPFNVSSPVTPSTPETTFPEIDTGQITNTFIGVFMFFIILVILVSMMLGFFNKGDDSDVMRYVLIFGVIVVVIFISIMLYLLL